MNLTLILNKLGLPLMIIFPLLIIGFILFFIRLFKVYFTKNWPTVTGTIKKNELVKRKSTKGRSAEGSIDVFDLKLKYEYIVEGEKYTSNKLRYFHATGNYKNNLEQYLKEFPQGSITQIYYNPRNPKQSVLVPGLTTGAWVPFLFFFIAIGSITPVIISKL